MSIFGSKYRPTDKENQIQSIIKKMLDHPKTIKLMDPIYDSYYLDNKHLNYFVIVTAEFIKITNHKFYYTNQINPKFSDLVIKDIRLAISKDRKQVEEEIFQNETELLKGIEQRLDEEKK